MKLRIWLLVGFAATVGIACVAKESMHVKVSESNELPRGRKIHYEGGSGQSREEAVIIVGAKDLKEGVAAEYDFISNLHGKKDAKWRVKAQNQTRDGDKLYDIIEMQLTGDNDTHFYYFDITNCSWHQAKTE